MPWRKLFCYVWKAHTPFKVRIFFWRSFLNRISTKDQLRRRSILSSPHDLPCTLCFHEEEDLCHVLFNCRVTVIIWKKVVDWYRLGEWSHSLEEFLEVNHEKFKKGKEGIVWMTVVWSLWKIKNDILFNDALCIFWDLLWEIKLSAWKWFLEGENSHSNCNFFEFWRIIWLVCVSFSWSGFSLPSFF